MCICLKYNYENHLRNKQNVFVWWVKWSTYVLSCYFNIDVLLCWPLYVCNSLSTFVSVFTIKRHKGASAAGEGGLLMVKTLNKACTSARRPNQATLTIHVYQGVKGKNHTISCVYFAAISLLKTTRLVWSQTLNW